MKTKLTYILFIAITAVSCSNTNRLGYNVNEEMSKIENQYESFANDPLKARVYTLENGLKVYFKACIFNGLERNIIASKGMKN